MQKLYRLTLHPSCSLEKGWELLEESGFEILYGQEEEHAEIFAYLPSYQSTLRFPWVMACTPFQLPSINWEEQWATHGQNYHDGYVHLEGIRLQPGAGFGDLSHPTTRLMLEFLKRYLQGQEVIDIGCGSGILTLAAIAMGSSKAIGIDIDPQALEHSRLNAILNHMQEKSFFCTPDEFDGVSGAPLILMNMIQSEQIEAWNSLPLLHNLKASWITSGIRVEEREDYLKLISKWGWSLQAELSEMDWQVYYFNTKD